MAASASDQSLDAPVPPAVRPCVAAVFAIRTRQREQAQPRSTHQGALLSALAVREAAVFCTACSTRRAASSASSKRDPRAEDNAGAATVAAGGGGGGSVPSVASAPPANSRAASRAGNRRGTRMPPAESAGSGHRAAKEPWRGRGCWRVVSPIWRLQQRTTNVASLAIGAGGPKKAPARQHAGGCMGRASAPWAPKAG